MKRAVLLALLLGSSLVGGYRLLAHPKPPDATRLQREAALTPAGFVYVPGGEAWFGTNDEDADETERPQRRAFLPSFYLGRCEVTQAEWKRFRPEYQIPKGAERLPVTNISYEDAEAYCRFVGGRMPTDAEWEKAARGAEGRRYPWGDRFQAERCNLVRPRGKNGQSAGLPAEACAVPGVRKGLLAVDVLPQGASPYGALNMAGNAWEWVSGYYQGDPLRRIIRGGAVGYSERSARTYARAIEGRGVT
jgi:formylglycine-generating enzyme required for sulfatase activity